MVFPGVLTGPAEGRLMMVCPIPMFEHRTLVLLGFTQNKR
jgi:hypothetical protein